VDSATKKKAFESTNKRLNMPKMKDIADLRKNILL
jgi:hypothetical protein